MKGTELNLDLEDDWLEEAEAQSLSDGLDQVLRGEEDGALFLHGLVRTVLNRVSAVTQTQLGLDNTSTVPVEIVGLTSLDTAEIYSRAERIYLGEGALREFANEALKVSSWLTSTFISNVGNMLGSLPGLSELCSVDRFPAAALRSRSSPKTDNHGGRNELAIKTARRLARGEPINLAESHGFHYDQWRLEVVSLTDAVDDATRWSTGSHVTRLATRLALGATIFAVSHELAHLALGHDKMICTSPDEFHRMEHDADVAALRSLLGTRSGLDIYAGLQVFRAIHRRSSSARSSPDSHPSSPVRLRVLGDALQEEVGGWVLRSELDDLRGDLEVELLQATPVDRQSQRWERAWLSTATTSQGCTIRLRVGHDISVDSLSADEEESLSIPVLLYCQAGDAESAHLDAVIHMSRMAFATQIRGAPKAISLYEARLPLPPSWRKSESITVVSAAAIGNNWALADGLPAFPEKYSAHRDHTVRLRHIEKTDAEVEWISSRSLVDDDTVNELLSRQWDSSEVFDFLNAAAWYGAVGNTSALQALLEHLADNDPSVLSHQVMEALLQLDVRAGRLDHAAALVQRFIEQWSKPNPGYFALMAHGAMSLGRYRDAFDYSFTEQFTFGSAGPWSGAASAAMDAALAIGAESQTPESQACAGLIRFLDAYSQACKKTMLPRRTAQRLRKALGVLEELRSELETTLAWKQYHAEVLSVLGSLGDTHADTEARREFEEIRSRWPWFTPALAQASWVVDRMGDTSQALELLKQAEDIAPMHEQVRQGWKRVFDQEVIVNPMQLDLPGAAFRGRYDPVTDYWWYEDIAQAVRQEER